MPETKGWGREGSVGLGGAKDGRGRGVGLDNVVAVGCRGVDVFFDFSGVERCHMVIADGEGDDVGSCRL